ncbi:MAG: DedA family protein [Deltaproteobacteria bacterium]|nr:DedA family protein [Deltaproteobacteria bacterium]
MQTIAAFFDIILHIDVHLDMLIAGAGVWVYFILFAIVFCETGLVVTPFLPGDSLLFAVGAFAATGSLELAWILGILFAAAVIGDSVNFYIGQAVGVKILDFRGGRLVRREHLERTHRFYERHGGKTIILARFMPIIRTFAPFVAGIGSMEYRRFFLFNITGAFLWVFSVVGGGYFFGNLPFVKRHFSLVILAIIIISCMPAVVEWLRQKKSA